MTSERGSLPSATATWQSLATLGRYVINRAVEGEDVRLGAAVASPTACGITLDDSAARNDAEALDRLLALADERKLERRRDALLAGDIVNRSEQRPALHPLLRDFGGTACRNAPAALRDDVLQTRARMQRDGGTAAQRAP